MAALNGRLPLSSLTHIGTDHYGRAAYLTTEAAASWARMRAAGMPFDISDSYRDYARQVAYYRNPPNAAGLAAVPGTSSHGLGRAVDARGACLTWLTRHGAAYGWVRTVPREPWHFEYIAARDQHRNDPPEDDVELTDLIGTTNPAKGTPSTVGEALAIAQNYSFAGWQQARQAAIDTAALSAQVTNLIGAVAALSRGEDFDEAKLRAGIRADVEAAVKAAVGDKLEFDVTITPRED